MKITKIKLNNFKQFKDFEWELNKDMNVNLLFGSNGVGKSSLFQYREIIRETESVENPVEIYNKYSTIGNDDNIDVYVEYEYQNEIHNYDLVVTPEGEITQNSSLDEFRNILFGKPEKIIDSLIKDGKTTITISELIGERDHLEEYFRYFGYKLSEMDNKIMSEFLKFENLSENLIEVSYCLIKRIDSKLVLIPFELESQSTKDYLKYFNVINQLESTDNEHVIFIDDFGTNQDEILTNKLLDNINRLARKNNRQVFIATKQLQLLDDKSMPIEELENLKKERWLLEKWINGTSRIINLTKHKSKSNLRNFYMSGRLGGNHNLDLS